ncbi:MAG: Tat pathway signal protein [Candidatus Ratteibacteria bacterium]
MGKYWGYLIHLGYNMWLDWENPDYSSYDITSTDYLRCEKEVWDKIIDKVIEEKINMVVIEIGEGIKYESHPEIAVKGSWTKKEIEKEIKKLKDAGIEVVPLLNFSTAHDNWLGKYSKMVSTDIYYGVCKDLIEEVIEIFKPKYFHLGMDEETYNHQFHYEYVVVRQYDLWWKDFYFFVNEVEKRNVRAWIWSDYLWHYRNEFFKKMPKSVLQSNWYYNTEFKDDIVYVRAFLELEEKGYHQIPTGSNWLTEKNFPLLVDFCKKSISDFNLLGFLQTVWRPVIKKYYDRFIKAIELLNNGRRIYEKK